MGSAYNPAAWTGFFSAEVGASAALAGLIFVAVSINLAQIVKQRQLVSRSAKALLSLMAVLFSSSLCLIPDLSRVILGYELTALGVAIWAGTACCYDGPGAVPSLITLSRICVAVGP